MLDQDIGGNMWKFLRAQGLRLMAPRHLSVVGLLLCSALVSPAQADQVTYYHTDALGSVVMESDAAGQVTYSREYRPYGDQVLGTPKDGPGFTGHVADVDTGLTYMQQRYYDPGIGRFLSVDPVTADGNTGGNFNRYKYAANNPYKFTDPDGRREAADRFGDQFKRDAEAGNLKVYEPFEAPAIAVTAIMAAPVIAVVAWEGGMWAMANPGTVATLGEVAGGAAGVSGMSGGAGQTANALSAEGRALMSATPVGSALKSDVFHRAASFVRAEAAQSGSHTPLVGGDGVTRTLTQMAGTLNDKAGRFEYIVDPAGKLTHQLFVPGGTINGVPIKP